MYKKILHYINEHKLIPPHKTIIVGISGGPDSVFLLHTLLNLKKSLKIQQIILAHINYHLRPESDNEQALVEHFAQKHTLRLHTHQATPNTTSEEALRNIRHTFFNTVQNTYSESILALGHTHNDNIETMLMFLLRGSGTYGLSGIKQKKDHIHPLLKTTKQDILTFLNTKNIPYAIDTSNTKNNYTRNKIRNILLPTINSLSSHKLKGIEHSLESLNTESTALRHYTCNTLRNISVSQSKDTFVLKRKAFTKLPKPVQLTLLRYITRNILNISHADIKSIQNKINNPTKNQTFRLKEALHLQTSYDTITLHFNI